MRQEPSITELITLSERLAKAPNLLPRHARTPDEILAIVLAGQELGFGPMASLRQLSLVQGKVTLGADTMLGLMLKAGIQIRWAADGSDGVAELHLARGEMKHVQRFTAADQKQAGLNTDVWRKFPGPMLRARCVSAAARAFAPDVLAGSYLAGELPDDRLEEGVGALDQLAERAPASAATVSPASAKALDAAKAQGFLPKHPIAEDPFLAVDLQIIDDPEALVGWMRSAIERAAGDRAAKETIWEAFCTRCADLEQHPKELLARATAK